MGFNNNPFHAELFLHSSRNFHIDDVLSLNNDKIDRYVDLNLRPMTRQIMHVQHHISQHMDTYNQAV